MKCRLCAGSCIVPGLCQHHFVKNFEKKVYSTIQKYSLISANDRIVVGASGGKDSTTLLYLLSQRFSHVTALAIDEGIKGYRDHSLEFLKVFCNKHHIKLRILSYRDYFGADLDEILKKISIKPCAICGVFRRYLLNIGSRGADVVAVGHNLDDECQAILMNLLKNQLPLLSRMGPKSGAEHRDGFVQRVKPLYFCSEKEVMTYSYVMGFCSTFDECPNARQSFRADVRDCLNELERDRAGFKQSLARWYLRILPRLQKSVARIPLSRCHQCGEIAEQKVCRACEFRDLVKQKCSL